jgi:hypothetical protein
MIRVDESKNIISAWLSRFNLSVRQMNLASCKVLKAAGAGSMTNAVTSLLIRGLDSNDEVLQARILALEPKLRKSGENGTSRRRQIMSASSIGGEPREIQFKVKAFEPCQCREASGHRLG